ncbi:P-loop containing nucleoside triphosphate hydrolase protein [Xylariaceae sp. FL0804]|nr:P-loop containing nucleoside triphosphate hydrolase protein [Xylariaceae sp. FL0804]
MDLRNNLFGRSPRSGLPGRQVQQGGPSGGGQPPPRQPDPYGGGQPPPRQPEAYGGRPSQYASPRAQREPPQQQYSEKHMQWQLRPARMQQDPSTYTFGNRCAVSVRDFAAELVPGDQSNSQGICFPLLLNKSFVVTAQPTQLAEDGTISLSEPQRMWSGITMTDMISAESYRNPEPLLSMDVEVSLASRSASAANLKIDQRDLWRFITQRLQGTVCAPKQRIVIDYNPKLMLVVQTVTVGSPESEPTSRPDARGVIADDPEWSLYYRSAPQTRRKDDKNPPPPRADMATAINFFKDSNSPFQLTGQAAAGAVNKNPLVRPDFKFADMGIGGLDDEFSTIFRRAFASRVFPSSLVAEMGISHVKGLLLYGPPGTGKTLIARQIGQMLNARPPKIINGPEILNKYVGQSEENVRKMFADAEKEYKEKGEESGLHIIIFDELDAVCKQRGSGSGGTGVGDSVVNQLLSKMDGVDQLNNILLIGMTNRKDMIDDALLRPGRLEVHVEISLPDEHGRTQILTIHTAKLKGMDRLDDDVDIAELAHVTKNYSGAEIAGLVKAALSYAFTRHTKIGDISGVSGDPNDVMLTRADFDRALEDVKPAFGVSEEELGNATTHGIIHYSPHIQSILRQGQTFVEVVRGDESVPVFSVLVHGPNSAGKTALAATIALKSEFPFAKLIRPIDVGTNETAKIEYLRRAFSDAYKSALSIVILDSIEQIIDWNPIGPRFSNAVAQYIGAVLGVSPPKGRRLLIIGTTSQHTMLEQHGVFKFDREIAVPAVKDHRELQQLLVESGRFDSPTDINEALNELQGITGTQTVGVGVKAVFLALASARKTTAMTGEPLPTTFAEEVSAIMAPSAV